MIALCGSSKMTFMLFCSCFMLAFAFFEEYRVFTLTSVQFGRLSTSSRLMSETVISFWYNSFWFG